MLARRRDPDAAPPPPRKRATRASRRRANDDDDGVSSSTKSSYDWMFNGGKQLFASGLSNFRNASASEKGVYVAGAMVGLWAVSAAVSAVLHVTAALAFGAVAVAAVPVVFATAASAGFVALGITALAGVGVLVLTAPIMAVFALLKVAVPLAGGFYIVSRVSPSLGGKLSDFAGSVATGLPSFISSSVSAKNPASQNPTVPAEPTASERLSEVTKPSSEQYLINDKLNKDLLRSFDERFRKRRERHRDVKRWSVDDVAEEMGLEGLGEFAPRFIEQNIDGRVALALSEDDLRMELGASLTLGERKRILLWLRKLQALEKERS
ncbi:hypothetical protein FVE85_1532 [Porphyridium purpureum]|uniref:SAM domain-containing protein n=1 Tax=Porphyridium purpureum TaxID=35688 RepID=A0A5J4YY24_PORPP|nr:hypothetical protein FVE85_1532 [Porphyridium purpureum]|eukprot:POR2336..scf209_3